MKGRQTPSHRVGTDSVQYLELGGADLLHFAMDGFAQFAWSVEFGLAYWSGADTLLYTLVNRREIIFSP